MRSKKNNKIFAHNNKYERNIFKKLGYKLENMETWKKVVLVIVLIVLVLALIVVSYAYSKLSMIDRVESVSKEELSCVDVDGYVNILLLGVDSRNMKDIKGAGADAIMVLSLEEETGKVRLMSVYRDTYLKNGNYDSYGKITDANRIGGPELMMKTLNQAMDLNIHQFVVVNFKIVSDLVNAVDGITVDVKDYEIDELNKYTIETAENIGQKKYNLVKKPGKQKLEGVQAVSYGRIRKGVGDDFKRTERMRTVISKVFSKLQKASPRELDKLLNKLLPQVQTNMKTKDMLVMASQLPNYKISGSTSWPYDVTTGYLNEISYVFADDLLSNTIKLHEKMFGQTDYEPSQRLYEINNHINSVIAGTDQRIPDELEELKKKEEEEKLKEEEEKKKKEEEEKKKQDEMQNQNGNTPVEPNTPDEPVNPVPPVNPDNPVDPPAPVPPDPQLPPAPPEPQVPDQGASAA